MLNYDVTLAWASLLLLAIGLVMVYSASIAMAEASANTGYRPWYFLARHAVFVVVGLLAALVAFQVHRDVLYRVQRLSIGGLEILKVGPDHVVGLACGDPLSELAAMVGVELPFCVFIVGAPDFYFDAEDWTIVRPPNGSKY